MSPSLEEFAPGFSWAQLTTLAADKPTPFLLLNPARIAQQYADLQQALPLAKVYYAIKANPAPAVLSTLAALGCGFELASRQELDTVRAYDVEPERIAFGNTIKKAADIQYYYDYGVRLFASDSAADIDKLAEAAPGAKVYVRLLAEPSATADWPLDRKFGCPAELAVKLLLRARDKGLIPYGISFHVGSQQNSPEPWAAALKRAAWVFEQVAEAGIELKLINLGGGLPVSYLKEVPSVNVYGEAILSYLHQYFPTMPELMIEPGRYLVAEAGLLVSEVMLITPKQENDPTRWVYLDVGIFGGMTEAMGEATKYPIVCQREGAGSAVILAGPTCDGRDILYDHYRYSLPDTLQQGELLCCLNAGAYTFSCGSVSYNGFAPVAAYTL